MSYFAKNGQQFQLLGVQEIEINPKRFTAAIAAKGDSTSKDSNLRNTFQTMHFFIPLHNYALFCVILSHKCIIKHIGDCGCSVGMTAKHYYY